MSKPLTTHSRAAGVCTIGFIFLDWGSASKSLGNTALNSEANYMKFKSRVKITFTKMEQKLPQGTVVSSYWTSIIKKGWGPFENLGVKLGEFTSRRHNFSNYQSPSESEEWQECNMETSECKMLLQPSKCTTLELFSPHVLKIKLLTSPPVLCKWRAE